MPQTTPVLKRRGRPRRKESFADWMDRLDMQVDREAERLTAERTILRPLSPGQRRIVQMLIEHLRRLPTLGLKRTSTINGNT